MGERIDRREAKWNLEFLIHLKELFPAIYILHAFLVIEISLALLVFGFKSFWKAMSKTEPFNNPSTFLNCIP